MELDFLLNMGMAGVFLYYLIDQNKQLNLLIRETIEKNTDAILLLEKSISKMVNKK